MYVVCVTVKVAPERVPAFIDATQENARQTRTEAGNVRFDVLQAEADPTQFLPLRGLPHQGRFRPPPADLPLPEVARDRRPLDGAAAPGRPPPEPVPAQHGVVSGPTTRSLLLGRELGQEAAAGDEGAAVAALADLLPVVEGGQGEVEGAPLHGGQLGLGPDRGTDGRRGEGGRCRARCRQWFRPARGARPAPALRPPPSGPPWPACRTRGHRRSPASSPSAARSPPPPPCRASPLPVPSVPPVLICEPRAAPAAPRRAARRAFYPICPPVLNPQSSAPRQAPGLAPSGPPVASAKGGCKGGLGCYTDPPAESSILGDRSDRPMRVQSAEFVLSVAQPAQLPKGDWPEIAFAGRSNVGKSSLINRLLGRRNLARTSSTPGRTRLLNFYAVNDAPPLRGSAGVRVRQGLPVRPGELVGAGRGVPHPPPAAPGGGPPRGRPPPPRPRPIRTCRPSWRPWVARAWWSSPRPTRWAGGERSRVLRAVEAALPPRARPAALRLGRERGGDRRAVAVDRGVAQDLGVGPPGGGAWGAGDGRASRAARAARIALTPPGEAVSISLTAGAHSPRPCASHQRGYDDPT